jgi:hypothetical protein
VNGVLKDNWTIIPYLVWFSECFINDFKVCTLKARSPSGH